MCCPSKALHIHEGHMSNEQAGEKEIVIAAHWRGILSALGYDLFDPHFKDTPERVARFLSSWHTNESSPPKMTTFLNDDGYDDAVATSGIAFHSMCAHHGVPFFGQAVVAYIPSAGGKIVGLSKMARVVDHFAHRYTTQERITKQVADYLEAELKPLAVGVILRGEHMCMSMRGVQKPGHNTVTSAMRGAFRENQAARTELITLVSGG